jgi:F-type H+-transporting ATPase subunit a
VTESGGPSSVEYIQHHLTNLSIGEGFWTLHLDTFFFAVALAVLLGWVAKKIGDNLDPDNPKGLQNFLEIFLDFVETQVKDAFQGYNPLIGPLAFTLFAWIFLMNAMDLLPVDLLPWLLSLVGVHHLRIVPTANLDTPLALAGSIFALIIFYNIKVKGLWGFIKMFLFHPFAAGNIIAKILLMPVNILMTTIEELAKPVSMG